MPLSPAALAAKQQIVFAYEELSLSPEEIASQFEDYGLSVEDVQALLADFSAKYRETLSLRSEAQTRGEGTKEDLEILLAEYRHLSRASDNDLVKERALKFLIQEHKGRNDLPTKNLALKERALGITEVNTSQRAQEFINVMRGIQERLANLQTPKPVLELENTT